MSIHYLYPKFTPTPCDAEPCSDFDPPRGPYTPPAIRLSFWSRMTRGQYLKTATWAAIGFGFVYAYFCFALAIPGFIWLAPLAMRMGQ